MLSKLDGYLRNFGFDEAQNTKIKKTLVRAGVGLGVAFIVLLWFFFTESEQAMERESPTTNSWGWIEGALVFFLVFFCRKKKAGGWSGVWWATVALILYYLLVRPLFLHSIESAVGDENATYLLVVFLIGVRLFLLYLWHNHEGFRSRMGLDRKLKKNESPDSKLVLLEDFSRFLTNIIIVMALYTLFSMVTPERYAFDPFKGIAPLEALGWASAYGGSLWLYHFGIYDRGPRWFGVVGVVASTTPGIYLILREIPPRFGFPLVENWVYFGVALIISWMIFMITSKST